MLETEDFYVNKRGKERIKTNLNAQYFIKKQSLQYLECRILNLSCSGAAVSLPINDKPEPEAVMFLDIFIPKTLSSISVVGEIKRIEHRDSELIIGIKFTDLLSPLSVKQLTGQGAS
jgi:hypothetical protein